MKALKLASSLGLSVLASINIQAIAEEKFAQGDKVQADVLHIGIWKSGVITEVLPFDRYRVQLDEELGRHEPTLCLAQFIRKTASAGNQATGNQAAQATGAGQGNAGNASAGANTSKFKTGQRVLADGIQLGNFKTGVITEVLPYDRYRVQFDDEVGKWGPTVILARNMKTLDGGTANQANVPLAAYQAPAQKQAQRPAHPTTAPTQPAQTSPAHKPHTATPADTDGLPQGKGKPPDGVYVAQKISPGGTLIGLGQLTIKGNTYSGIAGGAFAPFTLNGGNIVWSAGITGLPDGWQIRKSVYAGTDKQGRPYIQVYYRSKSGFNDMFDCLRE